MNSNLRSFNGRKTALYLKEILDNEGFHTLKQSDIEKAEIVAINAITDVLPRIYASIHVQPIIETSINYEERNIEVYFYFSDETLCWQC
jgi:hypothetical protein